MLVLQSCAHPSPRLWRQQHIWLY